MARAIAKTSISTQRSQSLTRRLSATLALFRCSVDRAENKFKFVLPARAGNALTGNGVFNLSSQRLFSVKGAGIQHYAINAVADRIDSSVTCYVASAALTVLFLP